MKVLLVEDDAVQVKLISKILSQEYTVQAASSLEEAESMFHLAAYDLFIVDLNLTDGSGADFCRYIRENESKSGILMLTASMSLEEKMKCFDSGVDDYLTKPFHAPELLARLRALYRRSSYTYFEDVLDANGLSLNILEKTVFRGKTPISLRPKEFEILAFLMRNKGCVITRSSILDHFWDDSQETLSNIVDAHIKNIREVIDKPFATTTIKTVRGYGYKIEK